MQSFARDLRFGFRNLVKTPGFTSIVVRQQGRRLPLGIPDIAMPEPLAVDFLPHDDELRHHLRSLAPGGC